MTRDTSISAFHKIKANGLLTTARYKVYKVLFTHGPLTAGEIFMHDSGHTFVKGSICARLTELQRQGVVKEVGTKECELTGYNAILWDVTSRLPEPLLKKEKKLSEAEKLLWQALPYLQEIDDDNKRNLTINVQRYFKI